ncbi:MAG: hypothetical protein QI223_10250 [Candidatus Korarchaeota archaeon]|nr:hypothetical protein [Candidatus Korarchaeota archaeon]
MCARVRTERIEAEDWIMRIVDASSGLVAEGTGRFYGYRTRYYEGAALKYEVYGLPFFIGYEDPAGTWTYAVVPWFLGEFVVTPPAPEADVKIWLEENNTPVVHVDTIHRGASMDPASSLEIYGEISRGELIYASDTWAGSGGSGWQPPGGGTLRVATSVSGEYLGYTRVTATSSELEGWSDYDNKSDHVYADTTPGNPP